MKYLKVIFPVLLAFAVAACAKPPQADIDAARTAVAAVEKNADVQAYAADVLKTAQDKLAQMDVELKAKHYDKVKTLAAEAKKAAETATAAAATNKEKAQADAGALLAALKKAIPVASAKLAAAKKVKGITLDFTTVAKQLAGAKAAVADAEKDLAAGDFATALQKAMAVQATLNDGEKSISDAIQTATSKKK